MKNNLIKKGAALFLATCFMLSQSAIPISAAEAEAFYEETEATNRMTSAYDTTGEDISTADAQQKESSVSENSVKNQNEEYNSDSTLQSESDNRFENKSDNESDIKSEIESDSVSISENKSDEKTEEIRYEITDSSKEAGSDKDNPGDAHSSPKANQESMQFRDLYNTESVIKVSMSSYVMPAEGRQLTAAVWSESKGQDDLTWYPMTKNAEGYEATVDIRNHKTSGIYDVHVYLKMADGRMQFVCKDTFQITDTSMDSLEILQESSDSSKATLVMHNVSAPSGVVSVSVPVWSRSDQRDIVWYNAVKTNDNTWTVDISCSRHENSIGTLYVAHVYATTGNGIFSKIGETKVSMERGKPLVDVKPCPKGIQLSLEYCTITNPKEVTFAVWSAYNGQDDLKWYPITNAVNGIYSTIIPFFKETGDYHIHCYARTTSGQMVFQNLFTYTPKLPSAENVTATVADKADGTFVISVSEITNEEMIKEILVPVWSKPDQSDLVWYKAAKQTDGTWQVKGNIFNHKGNSGHYTVHVYIKDLSDTNRFACKTDFQIEAPPISIDAVFNSEYSAVEMTASGVTIPDGVKEIRFAVWTTENGQDDLRWYAAKCNNGKYYTSAKLENHKGSGPLIIHAYAESSKGQLIFLKSFELQYSTTIKGSIRFDDFSEERFSSEMYIDLTDYQLGIKNVNIAVWSAPDQSDIYWYHANRSSENSWHAAFSPLNHKGHTGTFQVHAYVTFVNGKQVFAGKTEYTVAIENKQYVLENADGTVTAVLYSNQVLNSPSIAVWSKENGQDDLKWYPLSYNGKCYFATLSIRNHKHGGLYYGHFYGSNTFQGSVTFTFPETIGTTETVSRTPQAGHSDVKFFNGKLLCSISGSFLALRNLDGSIFRNYPSLNGFWLDALESDRLIVYSNTRRQVELAQLDNNFNVMWTKVVATLPNLAIDPCIVKNGQEYLITATEIIGKVNNSDPNEPNGTYTIHSWKSSDLIHWTEYTDITTENHNLEEIKMVEKDGVLYMAYEKEVVDKGNSSVLARVSYDNGKSWSEPIELLPADSDHEICNLSVNGDRFVLFYSSDKDSLGSSYMGAKAYYAVYDKNLNCISRDVEIKTATNGGILIYDVKWIDATHYILYSENYLTTGTLVVEKAK